MNGIINSQHRFFRCSANEKLEVIPEGELRPKAEVRPTIGASSPSIRSSGTKKRLTNAELSSIKLNNVNLFSLFCLILSCCLDFSSHDSFK